MKNLSNQSSASDAITPAPSRLIQHLPNWLTYLRLVLVPLFVVLMINPTDTMLNWATVVFTIGGLSDILDGRLARRYGVVSNIGKLLDPVADKVLVMAAMVMLVELRSEADGSSLIPGWMVVILLSREIWVTAMRGVAASRGVIMPAGGLGKLKTLTQMFGVGFVLLNMGFSFFGIGYHTRLLGLNLLVVSISLSIWSGVDYTVQAFTEKRGQIPPQSS